METVQELREKALKAHKASQTPEDAEKERKLVVAHQNIVQTMCIAISDAVKDAIEASPLVTNTVVMDPHTEADLMGLNYKTLLYGTYRKEKGRRDWKQHHFADIHMTPFEEAEKELKPFGVTKIIDDTDPALSAHIKLVVFF